MTDDRTSPSQSEQVDGNMQPWDESESDFLLPGRREERQGSKPGDVRVRIIRPAHPEFRRISQGILEATPAAYAP